MKVDTDIPIPERGRPAPIYVDHLRKLKVGNSMFFPEAEFTADIAQIGIGLRVAARRLWGKGNYTTRTVSEGLPLQLGVRIWRTK